MDTPINLVTPFSEVIVRSLRAGDQVLLNGFIYTARDAAHQRFAKLLARKQPLPVNLAGQLLYYTGPTPASRGRVIGSAGPTTSSRMDSCTPGLIAATGLRGMIGKGDRSPEVITSIVTHGCVYFAAIGGAGALIAKCIKHAKVVCYDDLGAEAVFQLEVARMPLTVAIDCEGTNLYVNGPEQFKKAI